jgi:DNA polymerase/3'-5' exonuclease PolX
MGKRTNDDRNYDSNNYSENEITSRKKKPKTEKPFPRNVKVSEVFKTLSDLHQSMPLLAVDQWKSYCFRIVAGRLLNLDFEVASDYATLRRLREIKGFGKSVVEKIQECLETGTVSRIKEFQNDPQRVAMKNLTSIWGVGTVKAKELMTLGCMSIQDVRRGLRDNKQGLSLDRNQLVGVDCYEDILDRMSRSEVEQIGELVGSTAETLFPGMEVSIQGSYRRGKQTCGDVDIHLTHPLYEDEFPDDALGRIIGKSNESSAAR